MAKLEGNQTSWDVPDRLINKAPNANWFKNWDRTFKRAARLRKFDRDAAKARARTTSKP
jgi:hypothetical protein